MSGEQVAWDILVRAKGEIDPSLIAALDGAIRKLDEFEKRVGNAGKNVIGGQGGGVLGDLRFNSAAMVEFEKHLDEVQKRLNAVLQVQKQVETWKPSGERSLTIEERALGLRTRSTEKFNSAGESLGRTSSVTQLPNELEAQMRKGELWASAIERETQARIDAWDRGHQKLADQERAAAEKLHAQNTGREVQFGNDRLKVADQFNQKDIQARLRNVSERQKLDLQEAQRAQHAIGFQQVQQMFPGGSVQTTQGIGAQGQLIQNKTYVDQYGNALAKLNGQTGMLTTSFQNFNNASGTFGAIMLNNIKKVAEWTLATSAVFVTLRALKQGIQDYAEFEQASVRLALSGRGLANSQEGIFRAARDTTEQLIGLRAELGGTSDEANAAAQTFAKMGLNQSQVLDAVRTAMIAANLSGESLSATATLLATAMQEFELPVGQLPTLLNEMNGLTKTTRVSLDALEQSVSRAGLAFFEAKGSMEELNAITAIVAQKTGRSGSEIGNALKTIIAHLGDLDIQTKVFARTGVVITNLAGEMKPISQIFSELGNSISQMSDQDTAATINLIGGARQKNTLIAILKGQAEIQQKVTDQLNESGSAAADNARVVDTLAGAWQRFGAEVERTSVQLAKAPAFLAKEGLGIGGSMMRFLRDVDLATSELIGIPTPSGISRILDLREYGEDRTTPDAAKSGGNNSTAMSGRAAVYNQKKKLAEQERDLFDQQLTDQDKYIKEQTRRSKLPSLEEAAAETETQRIDAKLSRLKSLERTLYGQMDSVTDRAQMEKLQEGRHEVILEIQSEEEARRGAVLKERLKTETEAHKASNEIGRKLRDADLAILAIEGPASGRGVREAQLKQRGDQIEKTLREADVARLSVSTPGETTEDKLSREHQLQEAKNEVQRLQNHLLHDEADIHVAIKNQMVKQTEERQKQIDQEKHALGQMNDLELLQARLLSAKIKAGDQSPLTAGQFLSLPQQQRQQLLNFDKASGSNLVPDTSLGVHGYFPRHDPTNSFPPGSEAARERDRIQQQYGIDRNRTGATFGPNASDAPGANGYGQALSRSVVNVNVDLKPLQMPADQLAQGIATLLAVKIDELIHGYRRDVEQNVAGKYKSPVRTV